MQTLARWVRLALILVAFILGGWFALENSTGVQVTLLGLGLPTLPLGVWLLLFAVLGVLLGFGFSSLSLYRVKRHLKHAEHERDRCEREVSKLRSTPPRA